MQLIVRKTQIEILAAAALDRNRREAPYRHLEECFPEETQRLGPDGVSELVSDAKARCAAYGIDDAAGLMRYLNLLMILGESFDLNGPFAWTAEILAGPVSSDEKFRTIFERLEIQEDDG